ncbi:DUF3969 family protein [Neisseria weixii]|uniref:DUF3969 family protein n=1 Tax=Neisseria weixii TaxID=1853276 RepID=A0A3N4MT96_9NEIS|nr:DUF3969 family protein [Neisseria weixii]RPD82970.1 DUF3969 family protein [Neisseria weixii]RPD83065.1 DUF3969 family protein [Neisseria weixii]
MNKDISVSRKINNMEIILNTYLLGVLTALLNEKFDIDGAQKLLFRPGMIDKLESVGIKKKYIDRLWCCTELEDLQDLAPHSFQQEIIKLINLCLNEFNEFNFLDNIDFINPLSE